MAYLTERSDEIPRWVAKEDRAQYGALQTKSRLLALRVMALVDGFPLSPSGKAISNQLVRAATSVAANYRAARRGRSKAEWMAKLGIVEEEADEVIFFLGLARDHGLAKDKECQELGRLADEVLSMTVSSIKTSRANKTDKRPIS